MQVVSSLSMTDNLSSAEHSWHIPFPVSYPPYFPLMEEGWRAWRGDWVEDEELECQDHIHDSEIDESAEWMLTEVSWKPLGVSMAYLSRCFPRQEDGHLWGPDCLC